MKRIIIVVLMLLFLSIFNVTYCQASDQNASEWAKEELNELALTGLYSEQVIDDYKKLITREEFVSLAVILFEHLNGKEIELDKKIYFKDTYNADVIKAATVGITSGTSYLEFDPDGLITREALIKMLVTVLEGGAIHLDYIDIPQFDDHKAMSEWAVESVYKAKGYSMISGDDFNKFHPDHNASIEECLLIISRIMKKVHGSHFSYDSTGSNEALYIDEKGFQTIEFDGNPYYGQVTNGQMNGYGTITYESGYSQKGYFTDNMYNGVIHTLKGDSIIHSQIFSNEELTNFGEVTIGAYHRYTGYIDKDNKPNGFGVVETDSIVLMPGWLSEPATKHQVGQWNGKVPVGYHTVDLKTHSGEEYIAKGIYRDGTPKGDFEINLIREDGTLDYKGEVTIGLIPVTSYNQAFIDTTGANKIKEFKANSNYVICEVGRVQNALNSEDISIQVAGKQIIDIMMSSTLLK